jgi:hypothetical protein
LIAALALGTACSKDSPTSANSTPLTLGSSVTIAGGEGSLRYFTVTVPSGASGLLVTLTGGLGDPDLYLRFGSRPTFSTYDCSSGGFDTEEECFIFAPTAGTWHIMVEGFETYSAVQLRAELATAVQEAAASEGSRQPKAKGE